MPRTRSWLLGVFALAACDDGAMAGDDGAQVERGCDTEIRDDDYALGLAKTGERWTVTFVEALPAPPTRGDNTWTMRVTDAAGAPVPGLELSVSPFMPDHMHGTTVETVVMEIGDGKYALDPVNLFMPGLWEVTLELGSESSEDEVTFAFCVDP